MLRSKVIIALAGLALFVGAMKVAAPLRAADADVVHASTLSVLQMQAEAPALPAQKIQDMTFALD